MVSSFMRIPSISLRMRGVIGAKSKDGLFYPISSARRTLLSITISRVASHDVHSLASVPAWAPALYTFCCADHHLTSDSLANRAAASALPSTPSSLRLALAPTNCAPMSWVAGCPAALEVAPVDQTLVIFAFDSRDQLS
jgi:hypothetical protein